MPAARSRNLALGGPARTGLGEKATKDSDPTHGSVGLVGN